MNAWDAIKDKVSGGRPETSLGYSLDIRRAFEIFAAIEPYLSPEAKIEAASAVNAEDGLAAHLATANQVLKAGLGGRS